MWNNLYLDSMQTVTNWSGMLGIAVSAEDFHLLRLLYLTVMIGSLTIMHCIDLSLPLVSTARYPSHQVSKWLDSSKEHSRDIDNLHSVDGDFHHGFNSGVLAASRMFKDHADVSHVSNDPVSRIRDIALLY